MFVLTCSTTAVASLSITCVSVSFHRHLVSAGNLLISSKRLNIGRKAHIVTQISLKHTDIDCNRIILASKQALAIREPSWKFKNVQNLFSLFFNLLRQSFTVSLTKISFSGTERIVEYSNSHLIRTLYV